MARIFPVLADADETGHQRELWLAEADSGDILGTGDTRELAALQAFTRLSRCADVAARRGLPNRYIRKLLDEAEMFRPAGATYQSGS